MADETTPGGEDVVKNIKAEFNRKLDNVSTQLAEQRQMNERLMSQVAALKPAPAASREPDLSELMYSDPAKYAEVIAERAASSVNSRLAADSKKASTIQRLVQEYPETGDQEHPLTKKAVEIYTSMPEDEKQTPQAYRTAVAEAAAELGIKPRSKRPQQDDEPSFGTSDRPSTRRRKSGSGDLDPNTEAFASIMGLDVKNPEVRKRLSERSDRNWQKYQAVKK